MDWKKFFKPSVAKIIILIVLVLTIGVPAYLSSCATHIPLGAEQECVGPDLTLLNIITYTFTSGFGADYNWDFNIPIILGYLAGIYLVLSLVFHIAGYKWKRALLYVAIAVILIFLIIFIISIMGNRTTAG